MQWHNGDVLELAESVKANIVLFTANSVVTDSRLVMGAGFAKQVRDTFKGIDLELGRTLLGSSGTNGVQPDYGLVTAVTRHNNRSLIIGALQVKKHYNDHKNVKTKQGCWELTESSLFMLQTTLRGWSKNLPPFVLVMNCPLIGLGGYASEKDKVVGLVENYLGEFEDVYVCTK